MLEPIAGKVDDILCSGCGVCASLCPYKAITMVDAPNDKRKANLNDAMCKGCGTSGGACPAKAIKMQHFTNPQIRAQIAALFTPAGGV
jgi:heterodisulfide reductase subunit A